MKPISHTSRFRVPALARLAYAACAAFASSLALGQTHGTYLPGTLNLSGFNNATWSNATATSFSTTVFDGQDKVGIIDFSYDTYTANWAANGKAYGGAGIAGGFIKDPLSQKILAADFKLKWIQIVQSSLTSNQWGAGKDTWYPDTLSNGNSPAYPFQYLPGGVTPTTVPDPAMQDFPIRPFVGKNINWQAMLALAALNPNTCEVRIIGMFEWGFDLTQAGQVTADAPHGWTQNANGMTTLTNTLTFYFDGNKHGNVTSKAWTFNTNSPWVMIPTPATAALLALAGLIAAPRRRAA